MSLLKNVFAENERELIAQLIGLLPLAISYFVFLSSDRRKMIALKSASDILWALHFLLLGEMAGATTNFINTARNLIFSQNDKRWCKHLFIPIFFCVLTLFGALSSFEGIKSLLPAIGSSLAIFGFWSRELKRIRAFNFFALLLWLVYGIITVSLSTILCNLLSLASIITAICKEHKVTKNEKRKNPESA